MNKKDKKDKQRGAKPSNASGRAEAPPKEVPEGKPYGNAGNTNKKVKWFPESKNVSRVIFPGDAIRTRDEYLKDGVEKEDHTDDTDRLYRVAYVIDTNRLDEIAIVKSTTTKGHHLKSKPDSKFKPSVYVLDDEDELIKLTPKGAEDKRFIRNSIDDLTVEDVEYIRDRVRKFADTWEKLAILKSGKKPGKKGKK
jgi:hypothetical protein